MTTVSIACVTLSVVSTPKGGTLDPGILFWCEVNGLMCRADPVEGVADGRPTFLETSVAGLVEGPGWPVPPAWTVIVLADRGLYAKGLFEGIDLLEMT